MGKKKFKETKFAKVLGGVLRVGSRVLSGASGGTIKPVLAAVVGLKDGLKKEWENNVNSQAGGEGQVDWVRMASLVATLGLIALVVMGKIDLDTFEQLLEAVKQ